MAEKRYEKRHKKRMQIRFGRDEVKKMAFTSDLSSGGLFIITGQPEVPGKHIRLELTLPHEDPIVVVGQVRWAKKVPGNLLRLAKKAGMGVQIKKFEQGQELFARYLASL